MMADSPEGQELQKAVCQAVLAYSEFLERNGLLCEFGVMANDPDWPRMKAEALVITAPYWDGGGGVEIELKGGALDRVYGDGTNPDPEGLGPQDIPHKRRKEV
jgi:hypothetical protein